MSNPIVSINGGTLFGESVSFFLQMPNGSYYDVYHCFQNGPVSSSYFEEAAAVMLLNTLQEKREEILQVATKHGAFNVRVFGSVVRGEETSRSDIDFLVDYDRDKTTPWFPGGLLMDWQDLLGRKVDVVTESGISPLIRERVLSEAKPL